MRGVLETRSTSLPSRGRMAHGAEAAACCAPHAGPAYRAASPAAAADVDPRSAPAIVRTAAPAAIFLFVLGKVRVLLTRGAGAATARQKKRRANEHQRNRFRGPAREVRARATGLCGFSHAKRYLSSPVRGSKPKERSR